MWAVSKLNTTSTVFSQECLYSFRKARRLTMGGDPFDEGESKRGQRRGGQPSMSAEQATPCRVIEASATSNGKNENWCHETDCASIEMVKYKSQIA